MSLLIESNKFNSFSQNINSYENYNTLNTINPINHIDLIYDMLNIITLSDNNFIKLKEFINKYNLIQDKITDMYSYYDYYNDNIKINIILLDNNYIYSIYYKKSDTDIINAYEASINIDSNMIYIKSVSDGFNKFDFAKYNDYVHSTFYGNKTTHFQYIFKEIKLNYISNLDKQIIDHITKYDLNQFEHTKNGNIQNFIVNNNDLFFNILYQNQHLYISTHQNNISNIKYIDNYLVDSSDTFIIHYQKDNNTHIISKKIYIRDKMCFDSEICIDGYAHNINKLYYDFEDINIKYIKSRELPYFLFDNIPNKNLLTVYAFSEPCTYHFTVNLLNLNNFPTQYKYVLDNFGGLFSVKIITADNEIIEYYDSNSNKITIDKSKLDLNLMSDYEKYQIILKDITNRYECGKISSDYKLNLDVFNKEYEFGYDKYLYKFIINCGLTQSKQIENIAIVVESGTSTHDISKIILKNNGSVEIVRTNNNNQLIVKSATRNRFEGNVGYKFAISGGIPCVVSLDVPDDAEVVFDHYHNKFRCNKCIVKDIQPIANNNKKVKEIENTCSVCLTETPNVMFSPCQHVACHQCVASVTCSNNECYECKKKIESYITMKEDLVSEKIQIEKANSAIYCTDFEYKIGQTIIIDNFNITSYSKCSAGIHFHNKIDDVYNWLEFIDIPSSLKVKIPDTLADELKDAQTNTNQTENEWTVVTKKKTKNNRCI